ncbi:MAG: hypothetical protein HN380_16645, partial [Victivallales bacterium]|nr:hypothetical protein [Victivallales bacterium]
MSNTMLAEPETQAVADDGGDVVMQIPPKFAQSPRIQRLAQRSRDLAIGG